MGLLPLAQLDLSCTGVTGSVGITHHARATQSHILHARAHMKGYRSKSRGGDRERVCLLQDMTLCYMNNHTINSGSISTHILTTHSKIYKYPTNISTITVIFTDTRPGRPHTTITCMHMRLVQRYRSASLLLSHMFNCM